MTLSVPLKKNTIPTPPRRPCSSFPPNCVFTTVRFFSSPTLEDGSFGSHTTFLSFVEKALDGLSTYGSDRFNPKIQFLPPPPSPFQVFPLAPCLRFLKARIILRQSFVYVEDTVVFFSFCILMTFFVSLVIIVSLPIVSPSFFPRSPLCTLLFLPLSFFFPLSPGSLHNHCKLSHRNDLPLPFPIPFPPLPISACVFCFFSRPMTLQSTFPCYSAALFHLGILLPCFCCALFF